MVEVVTKSNLARELRQIALAALTHQLLEGKVYEFAFGAYAGERERLLDELIVDHDVGTHSFSLVFLNGVFVGVLYTVRELGYLRACELLDTVIFSK
jgi:hypothetical protein